MTVDPAAVLSEGLEMLNGLRDNHLAAQRRVDVVKQEAQDASTASKERIRGIIDAEKERSSDALTEAKQRASEIIAAARQRADELLAETRARTDDELEQVRQETTAEHNAVLKQADARVDQAQREAEGPRSEYADGIAQLVSTGWATTASLASYGHRTPKRPKGLHVEQ